MARYAVVVHTGHSSLTNQLYDSTLKFLLDPRTPIDRKLYDDMIAWATDIAETSFADLDSIHQYMIDSVSTPGAITLCATAFKNKWASNKANAFPLDDRQIYAAVTNFLVQKITYQAQGVK